MPFKRNGHKENDRDALVKRITKLEVEFKRINTLEVTMKRFLKMESHLLAISTMNALEESAVKGKKEKQYPSIPDDFEAKINATVEKRMRAQWFHEMDKLKEQLHVLTQNMTSLKERIQQCESENKQIFEEFQEIKKALGSQTQSTHLPIVYQDIKVERMLIDKYELNNNIAHLGVRDLSGSLNVGATYGTGIIPSDLAEDFLSTMNDFKKGKKGEQKGDEQTEQADTHEDKSGGMKVDMNEKGTEIFIEED
ncbi:hypothetical protein E1I69_14120 [Bacillus timonensis]|uniref:Uncharacterized protein n=1 Tax=Bacillus timonensis TaxID=1033734 RepID=A0A4S3PQR7_9BACI|nr:hypothetical protein [Bacillus timonensis]THE11585.1 hypothetical protein E1I69_14120 [Bacillus timonensis]